MTPLTVEQQALVLKWTRFAFKRARFWYGIYSRMRSLAIDLEDMQAAALLGITMAATRFDADRGLSFATYADHYIRGSCQDCAKHAGVISGPRGNAYELSSDSKEKLQAANRLVRLDRVCGIHDLPGGERLVEEDAEELEHQAEVAHLVEGLLCWCSDREEHIVRRHYLDGDSMDDVAREEGVSRARAHQLKARAIEKMKKAALWGAAAVGGGSGSL